MNRLLSFALGVALLALFCGYLITCMVNFDETVLITTFGKASEESVKNCDGTGAGLYLKWPWPIQQVVRFDRRLQVLEDRLEQQETSDKQVLIIKAYAVWQVSDALAFYRSFVSSAKAHEFLRDRLRTAKAEIGRFSFDDLTNADPEKLHLKKAEEALLQRIRKDLSTQACGIDVHAVGINRIVLPENITRSVFTRMRQTRNRLAQNARSEGKAAAKSIIATTDSDRKRILAFTERISQNIRAQGDAAAAEYYAEYEKNEKFAIFLRKLDALKKSLEKNTTFILDTQSEPFDLLKD